MKQVMGKMIEAMPLRIRKKIFYALQRSIRGDIANDYLSKNKHVLGGEFKGLKLLDDVSVQNYTLAHMLGIYEPNIQTVIIQKMKNYDRFVDVGCASGVFSVGVPFVTGKNALGFDVDETQVSYANALAKLNGLQDKSHHLHVGLDEDYNARLKAKDLCLVDIEGGEIDFIKSLDNDLRATVAFVIEVHEIGASSVADVTKNLVSILAETHTAEIVDEEFHLDFKPVGDLKVISRNDYVYFSNGQRDYFQKWIIFEPK